MRSRRQDLEEGAMGDGCQTVGWGCGGALRRWGQFYRERLDFLVDSDSAKHGQTMFGLEVRSPDCLRAAGGQAFEIIIFSEFFEEIRAQCASLPNVRILNAADPANIVDPRALTFAPAGNHTAEEVAARLGNAEWYHRIRIGDFVTPGHHFEHVWSLIRKSRSHLDYRGKRVLDLGSWDGLWTFEAEQLGAREVIATEIQTRPFQNFLNCRELIGSQALPFYNVSPYRLTDRLDVVMNSADGETIDGFDIVQYMGILYHLRDPLLALSQIRSVLNPGGSMLLETAVMVDETSPHMVYNHDGSDVFRLYSKDMTTWWVPTIKCLRDMLRSSMFDVVEGSESLYGLPGDLGRIALVAVPADRVESPLLRTELSRLDRNPGLSADVFRRTS